jgi:DNA sulfur modification protein DndE
MESAIDRFRLSETAKEQLTRIKRATKIEQWNTLCRWAFCLSLSLPDAPSSINCRFADFKSAKGIKASQGEE